MRRIVVLCLLPLCLVAASSAPDEATPDQIGRAIAAACPASAPDTAAERDRCAARLGQSALLDRISGDSILWGGAADGDFRPEKNELTRLNALVWRKLYLSLFRFDGSVTSEPLDADRTLLRLGTTLRRLPPGDFPYPFWHSAAKWAAYQQNSQIALVLFRGRLVAGYRNGRIDAARPIEDRRWDQAWRWSDGGREQPRVALYSYLLSPRNPNTAALDQSYRQLETALRPYNCTACHNPANPHHVVPLVFFTHPAQALTSRHQIARMLQLNRMPPEGIADDAERSRLIALAARFARTGDAALAFERRGSEMPGQSRTR